MKRAVFFAIVVLIAICLLVGMRSYWRYGTREVMIVPIEEVLTSEYPEDPAHHSVKYNQYDGRRLRLVQRDETHFDFVFESTDPSVATVALRQVDVGLLVPTLPQWTRNDNNLEVIALVDREWNRQQVLFGRSAPQLEISGGDGFEVEHTYTVELARNCLNAGLWEILMFTEEGGRKALYYQGWFTFPLGQYKRIFEIQNDCSYWSYWYRLEHWINPQGRHMSLGKLRSIVSEEVVEVTRNQTESMLKAGEQVNKSRTVDAKGVRCWGDFCAVPQKVRFATFVPPGRYKVSRPWGNEYERIAVLDEVIHRRVQTVNGQELDEIEAAYRHSKDGEVNRFVISGIDIAKLPKLPPERYHEGLYMPMGIGVPPFYQSYEELKHAPPQESPYFCMLLDADDKWINHHDVAIDGPVIHRDDQNPHILHLYLLSYERHSLVDHLVIELSPSLLP